MQSQQDESKNEPIRRSERQRVVSPIYAEGMRQLKLNLHKPPHKRPEQQADSHLSNASEQRQSRQSDDNDWLRCTLRDETSEPREIMVQVVLSCHSHFTRSRMGKAANTWSGQKQTEEREEVEPRKILRKRSGSARQQEEEPKERSGLLKMLYDTIKRVAEEPDEHANDGHEHAQEPVDKSQSTPGKRDNKTDKDGRLTGVQNFTDHVVFSHSKMGDFQVPFQAVSTSPSKTSTPGKFDLESLKVKFDDYKKYSKPLILN